MGQQAQRSLGYAQINLGVHKNKKQQQKLMPGLYHSTSESSQSAAPVSVFLNLPIEDVDVQLPPPHRARMTAM